MKRLLSSRGLFLLGFLILVASNIVVLSGVASNKYGEPESQVTLTERELQLPYKIHQENSGLALRLTWRALGKIDNHGSYSDWRSPAWLSEKKLEELEFDINDFLRSNGDTTSYKQAIPKEVYIVLENDGESYREALKRAEVALDRENNSVQLNPGNKKLRTSFESAKKRLEDERISESRLFAIDAGLDPIELRKKYGDRTRFIIVKGLVKIRYIHNKNKKEAFGYISRLSVASIYVPLKHRQIFDSILAQNKFGKKHSGPPRYDATIAYGKRLESYIISVEERSADRDKMR